MYKLDAKVLWSRVCILSEKSPGLQDSFISVFKFSPSKEIWNKIHTGVEHKIYNCNIVICEFVMCLHGKRSHSFIISSFGVCRSSHITVGLWWEWE